MLRFALIPVLLLSLLPEAFAARSKGFRPAKTCEEYFSDSAIRDANYVDYEDDAGLVTEDVALTPEAVLEAYSKGVFPWIDYGKTAGWYVLKNRSRRGF